MSDRGEQMNEAESIRLMMFMSLQDLTNLSEAVRRRKDILDEIDDLQTRVMKLRAQLDENTENLGAHQRLLGRPSDELLSNLSLVLSAKQQVVSSDAGATPPPAPPPTPPTTTTQINEALFAKREESVAQVLEFDDDEKTCIARFGQCNNCPVKAKDQWCKIKRRTNVKEHIAETQERIERLKQYGSSTARRSKNVRIGTG